MRNKSLPALIIAILLLACVTLLLMAFLGFLALRCGQEQYDRLLLACEASGANPGLRQVEDFCEEEFLVTYEIQRQATAEAHRYTRQVTFIGTNSCYAQVLGYRTLNGGFFSEAAWKAGNREAVLNAAAAFQLLGSYDVVGRSIKIDGESWLVTGVVDDGDEENACVYAPSSVTGGQARDLIALLDKGKVSADYAKNALKKLGVYEQSYTTVNLSAMAGAFGQRLWVTLYAALCLLILLLLRLGAGRLYARLSGLRNQIGKMYLRELLTADRGDLLKTMLIALGMPAGVAALLTLSTKILEICLNWQDLLPEGHAWATGGFSAKLAWLHDYQPWSLALFVLVMILLALLLVLAWRLPLLQKPKNINGGIDHGEPKLA